jgi:tRNA 2-thiouridine synthesizing protein A
MSDAPLVDARGMRCPWPVLRAARAMREAESVRILADDPIAGGELETLARERGWQFERRSEAEFFFSKQRVSSS